MEISQDSSLINETYKLAYINLKREHEEANKRASDTIIALAMEKAELINENSKYRGIVEKLAEELEKLTDNIKALEKAGDENVNLRQKTQKLEEELCFVTLEYNNAISQNQQLKQSLKRLQGKVIDYITEGNN